MVNFAIDMWTKQGLVFLPDNDCPTLFVVSDATVNGISSTTLKIVCVSYQMFHLIVLGRDK